ncbi:exodeoxyribonuclease V subunit gamma [Vibrio vulnificus]|nr:exodeoxyribonuclease V subunit gamma [Vibrio vulnificus]
MLNVYHSNSMDLLKTLVIQLIKNDPLTEVFEEEKILVQSSGISQWLKMALADEIGITANTKFPLPATFLWDMFKTVIPELPKENAFSKEMMKWKIMKILPTVIDLKEFEPIKTYLANDSNGTKNHQLADKISDIYDQYSVFRPEWIAEWEAGSWDNDLVGHHSWQPILWKLLVEYTEQLGQPKFHRANMYETFIEKVNKGDFDKSKLPRRLFVVGISSLPPRFLDALQALSYHIEIHLMYSNPCKYYWGDIKDRKYLAKFEAKRRKKIMLEQTRTVDLGESSLLKSGLDHALFVGDDETLGASVGNNLLASMGKTGRDYLSLLSEKETYEIDAFVEIERDSLLHNIQADILNLEDKSQQVKFDTNEGKGLILESDDSLTLHGSFSPQREVEVLHDYLLNEFNDDNTLNPQDVVVMVSDIDKYSPHINAVFSGAPKDRYIPFSVSDRTVTTEAPVLQVFLDLLSIGIGRQEATKVMEILEAPSIMRRFEIDPDGLSTISIWIEQAGIRWGLDEKTSTMNGLPAPKHNHWLFGLSRMIMGYAIPEDEGSFEGILPYNESQGSVAELAGKLGAFVDSLIELRDQLFKDHSIISWIDIINNLIDTFFDITRDEEEAIANIRTKVSDLYRAVSSSDYKDKISTDIIFRHFNGIFSKDRLSQHFMIGKVTFCTLMPMRSIPFRKVCLLGMNDGLYPRSSQPEGFDLMASNPLIGDRSRRNDDRFLFLEALLSAQDSLYISYVDRKIQDNTNRVPSVLVSELVEYVQKGYCLDSDFSIDAASAEDSIIRNISFQHSLNPFSPSAFDGKYQSYASEWVAPSMTLTTKSDIRAESFIAKPLENILFTETSSDSRVKLDISELLRFWSLPVKHFFTRRLKVNFDLQAGLTNDEEPFTLEPREAFPVKRQWLENLIENLNKGYLQETTTDLVFESMLNRFSQEGALPNGGFAYNCLEEIRDSIETLANEVTQVTTSELLEEKIDLYFEINSLTVNLHGWARRLYKTGSVYYRAGSLRPQDIMQAWIQHLAVCSNGMELPTYILCTNEQVVMKPIKKEASNVLLKELVNGYYEGMCSPIPFLPRTSFAALQATYSKKDRKFYGDFNDNRDKITAAIIEAMNGGFGSYGGEASNPYVSRVWSEVDDEFVESVYGIATTYLLPALMSLDEYSS